MAEFDPDAYLGTSQQFDPDTYIKGKKPQNLPPLVDRLKRQA
jgi:hypothetical protein